MVTLIYLLSFLFVLVCIALVIFANIKGSSHFLYMALATLFCILFIFGSFLNENKVNKCMVEIVNKERSVSGEGYVYVNSTNISEYDKRRNEIELNIISSENWNKEESDPIKSGNLKVGASTLKKAIIRVGMSKPLKDYYQSLKNDPCKYIGEIFTGEAEVVNYKKMDSTNILTQLTGSQKVAIYFHVAEGGDTKIKDAVLYLDYNKDRSYDSFGEIRGIFVGIANEDNDKLLVFVGR